MRLRNKNVQAPMMSIAIGALLVVTSACTPKAPPPAPPPSAPPASMPAPTSETPATMVTQTIVQVAAASSEPSPADLGALPELPRPSPNAEVRQHVGITSLHVSYSSPAVNGRTVWGELVPYDKLWRMGANAPTKLTVSRDFTFGGKAVPAGSYSMFTIPGKTTWAVILNKDPKGQGAFEHDPKLDVARVDISPTDAPPRERLAFVFEDSTEDATKLVMDWGALKVAIPITVNTKDHVEKGIAATLDNAWRPMFNAGRYSFDKGDHARALELFNQSIEIRGTWWNHWWAAQVLAKLNKHQEARVHAQKAIDLGKDDAVFKRAFAEPIKKALGDWPQS